MLEEGIDVAACDLVVRYSGVSTLIQYIQSRGRARKCDSRFVVLVTPEEEQQSRHIQEEERILDLILDTHATQFYLPSEKTLSIIQSINKGCNAEENNTKVNNGAATALYKNYNSTDHHEQIEFFVEGRKQGIKAEIIQENIDRQVQG